MLKEDDEDTTIEKVQDLTVGVPLAFCEVITFTLLAATMIQLIGTVITTSADVRLIRNNISIIEKCMDKYSHIDLQNTVNV